MLSVLLAIMVVSFGLLTVDVWHTNRQVGLDRAAARVGIASGEDASLAADGRRAKMAEQLGSRRGVGLATGLFVGLAVLWRQWVAGLVCLIAPVACFFVIEYVAKPLINEPIPFGGRAYPSGHAAGVAAVATSATMLVYRRWGGVAAIAFAPVAVGAVIAVGFGVLALRFHHYPTDVFGGVALGAAKVIALTILLSVAWGRLVDGSTGLNSWRSGLTARCWRAPGR